MLVSNATQLARAKSKLLWKCNLVPVSFLQLVPKLSQFLKWISDCEILTGILSMLSTHVTSPFCSCLTIYTSMDPFNLLLLMLPCVVDLPWWSSKSFSRIMSFHCPFDYIEMKNICRKSAWYFLPKVLWHSSSHTKSKNLQ